MGVAQVTWPLQFLAVRSAMLATAWLLVSRTYVTVALICYCVARRLFVVCRLSSSVRNVYCVYNRCVLEQKLLYWQPAAYRKSYMNKKAQLSLTKPRDAKACQIQFDMLTTLSLTILVCLHSFSCCCVRNLQNPEKFSELFQSHPMSSILVSIESAYATSC